LTKADRNRLEWDWKGPTGRSGPGVLASERSEASESREELCSDRVHESFALVSQQDRNAIL
jgi:hypothetical protein